MTVRRASAIAGGALVVTAIGLTTAVFAKENSQRPRGVVENCSTQSSAGFPHAYTSPHNLVAGPLALVDAGGTAAFVWDSSRHTEGFNKFAALVMQGHRVTVELSRKTRRGAGLAYGPEPHGGEIHLRDTHRVVTFIACKRDSGSTADGRPVTFWSGGVLARSPRCVPLLVWVDKRLKPRRVVIHFGVRNCR
jgi:hypothetical protein